MRYIVNIEAAIWRDGQYLMIVRGMEESHAPGTLSLVGGKVDSSGSLDDVVEETLRREIREEVDIEVAADMEYIESKLFTGDNGNPVVDIVFLCRYKSGLPTISDPGEVAEFRWMTAKEVLADPAAPSWTKQSIERVEQKRAQMGW